VLRQQLGTMVKAGNGLETAELMLLNREEERVLTTEVRVAMLLATEACLEGAAKASLEANVEALEGLVRMIALSSVIGGAWTKKSAAMAALSSERLTFLGRLLLCSYKLELFTQLDAIVAQEQTAHFLYNDLISKEVQQHAQVSFNAASICFSCRSRSDDSTINGMR
jgi:hypothetical protein